MVQVSAIAGKSFIRQEIVFPNVDKKGEKSSSLIDLSVWNAHVLTTFIYLGVTSQKCLSGCPMFVLPSPSAQWVCLPRRKGLHCRIFPTEIAFNMKYRNANIYFCSFKFFSLILNSLSRILRYLCVKLFFKRR